MKIKNKNSLTIIFTGTSGSGKGTHAAKLVKDFGFKHISVGNIIRKAAQEDTEEGREIERIVNELGKLLPARQASDMLEKELQKMPKKDNLLIDGYPRSVDQIKHLDEMLSKIGRDEYIVLNIHVSDEIALERLSSRLVCSSCKKNFKANGKELVEGAKCPDCDGILTRRPDDTPEKVKERLRWSHREVKPVLDEYKKRGNIEDVNGGEALDVVYQNIIKAIEKHI